MTILFAKYEIPCPISDCERIIKVDEEGKGTLHRRVRRNIEMHLHSWHPGLGLREVSLICDDVVEQFEEVLNDIKEEGES